MSELIHHGLIDPVTYELMWTMGISVFLLLAGTLTAWMLPWSDTEIDAVYSSITRSFSPQTKPASIFPTTKSPTPLLSK
jgi:hypothetical protein